MRQKRMAVRTTVRSVRQRSIQSDDRGLSSKEAAARLAKNGPNELPTQEKQSVLAMFLSVMREPMLLMLLGSGAIYLLLGEPKDALTLLSFVVVVIGITFHQERKTERALESLRSLACPKANVIRDGSLVTAPSRDLVVGDVIVVAEGERIPADAAVLASSHLLCDESLLTGESVPVRKSVWDHTSGYERPGGEDLPFVFSGTMVTQGHATAVVTGTGSATEIGKIGSSLRGITDEDTLLKRETGRIVQRFTVAGIILCVLVVVAYVVTKGSLMKGLLAGISLGMAMLPEEFPVVLLIFLSLGAWRISKKRVLTRKTAAIETLGAATVLCVDKTGTITQNRMRLDALVADGKVFDCTEAAKPLPEPFHPVCEYAYLASQRDPFDPIERGIKERIDLHLSRTEHVHATWNLVHEYPLSKEMLALSHVWERGGDGTKCVAAKGAPEAIADLCHMDPAASKRMLKDVKRLADRGLRILGVAKATFDGVKVASTQHDYDFSFVGLIGFSDPIRDAVPAALAECYGAGVRTVMITGDYPGTAQFIARKIGLKNPETVITGPELASLSPEELAKRVRSVNVFARVVPEQKLLIVNAFKANGEIVAMTGDGVNDAPALKAAHIGIAMGERGTDVAREAADLILLNDDFSSIADAIRLGRRIYDNIRNAISFVVSVHIPIAGMSLLPVLFNMPVVLLPAHIAFLELIIDPACSVVYEAEPEEPTVMRRPPRAITESLIGNRTLFGSLVQGLALLMVTFFVYMMTMRTGYAESVSRTMTFITIVMGNLLLIVSNLSMTQLSVRTVMNGNRSLYAVLAGAMMCLLMVIGIPQLREIFGFGSVTVGQYIACTAVAGLTFATFELYKFVRIQSAAVR